MQCLGNHNAQCVVLEQEVSPKVEYDMCHDHEKQDIEDEFVHLFGKSMQPFGTDARIDLQSSKRLDCKRRSKAGKGASAHHDRYAVLQYAMFEDVHPFCPAR